MWAACNTRLPCNHTKHVTSLSKNKIHPNHTRCRWVWHPFCIHCDHLFYKKELRGITTSSFWIIHLGLKHRFFLVTLSFFNRWMFNFKTLCKLLYWPNLSSIIIYNKLYSYVNITYGTAVYCFKDSSLWVH